MCSRSTTMTECGCVWAKTQFTSTAAMAMVRHGACNIISTSVKPCCCPWKNQSQSLTRSSRKPSWGNCQKFLTRMGMYSCYDVLSWLMYNILLPGHMRTTWHWWLRGVPALDVRCCSCVLFMWLPPPLLCCVWLGAVHKFGFELLQSEHSTNGNRWSVTDAVTQIYVLTGPLCFLYKGTYPNCWGQNLLFEVSRINGSTFPLFLCSIQHEDFCVLPCAVATCNIANSTVTFCVFCCCTLCCIVIVLFDVMLTNCG